MSDMVLLVEDDAAVRDALCQTLELAGIEACPASSFVAAKDQITAAFPGVILSDIRMPGRDGFYLLDYAKAQDPELPVILLTGEGDVPTAVQGMSGGAFAFLEKPCAPKDLLDTLHAALAARRAVLDARKAKRAQEAGDAAARLLLGTSPLAEALRSRARAVARGAGAVLIHGEAGTGTSKVAEVIHLLSARSKGTFLKRAAAGLDPKALSELLELAQGGSLFLDEITALPAESQFMLSETMDSALDTRILAATHHDPDTLMSENGLHADLYYRLEGMRVRIPSLRERPNDIPTLFSHYLTTACEQAALPLPQVPSDLPEKLMMQDWPGNARALMNAAMRFAMGVDDGAQDQGATQGQGLAERLRAVERRILIDTLRQHQGQATAAAKALKLPRKTFYDKLARHEIRAEDFR